MDAEWTDDDGYPTEEALTLIETWDWKDDTAKNGMADVNHLFDFMKSIWWCPDFGWSVDHDALDYFGDPVTRYDLSTGGWSGNESIIAALKANFIVWSTTWESSRRGGHYVFEVKR